MGKSSKAPKNQTVTNTPYFKQEAGQLAGRVTDNALNNPAFQGRTQAGLSGLQQQAIGNINDIVGQGNQQIDAAQNLNQQTLQGAFLGPNPNLSAALAPIREEFQRTVAPSIDAAASGAGRLGSGAHAVQQDTAQQSLSDSMARVAYDNYNAERGRQQQALGMAPGLSQARLADQNALLQAGALHRSGHQAKLSDQARQFYETQQSPMAALGAIQGVGGITQQPGMYQGSKLGGALGGGLAGAGTGAMIGSVVPGFGTGTGALLGGGIGLAGGLFG